jgi:hypothetical protein
VSSGCVLSSPRSCLIAALEVLHVRAGEPDSSYSTLQQIFWNFSHFVDTKKRLTLAQNPHFYKDLPKMSHYQKDFTRSPTSTYDDGTIFVVISNPGGEFVEIESAPKGGGKAVTTGWVFDNVLVAEKTLLFRS